MSLAPDYRYHPSWHSPLLIRAPFVVIRLFLGSADASGALQVPFDVPELPPGTVLSWHAQAVSLSTSGQVFLGPARELTSLGSSY